MFSNWLEKELKRLKLDVSVYHSYILGILEDNIDENEKREMITDIVSSLVENDTELFINTLFEKWLESQGPVAQSSKDVSKQEEVDIAKLLETQAAIAQAASRQNHREISEEERRIKQQILASYSQTEAFNENGDEEEGSGDGSDDDPNLEKNTNKADVQKLAREKREQARLESAAKKQKDKEDRAKQKATREEKKANRKAAAVKGERKR